MNTKAVIGIVVVLLVLAGVVVTSIVAGGKGDGTEVYLEAAERRSIVRAVKASGEIDPRVKVNLSSQVIGKIERLYVEEGDEVAEGDLFLELEKDSFLAARDRARAALRIARSRQRQAEIEIEDAAVQLGRLERLHAEKIASRADLESAQLAHLSKELALEQAKEAVTQAIATLEQADDDLSKCTLFAPLTGRVIALHTEEGESVIPGTMNNPGSVLGTIADLSEILALVEVDETEVTYLEMGQRATVLVDALSEREYEGTIVEIGSSGFSNPRQPDVTFFEVKLLLADGDTALRPGMSLRVEISTAEEPDALAVPIQAVVEREPRVKDAEGGGDDDEADKVQVVFVLEDGTAMQREIETGLSDTTHVEIVAGVEEGEEVVTGPYRELRDLEHEDAILAKDPDDDEEDEESS